MLPPSGKSLWAPLLALIVASAMVSGCRNQVVVADPTTPLEAPGDEHQPSPAELAAQAAFDAWELVRQIRMSGGDVVVPLLAEALGVIEEGRQRVQQAQVYALRSEEAARQLGDEEAVVDAMRARVESQELLIEVFAMTTEELPLSLDVVEDALSLLLDIQTSLADDLFMIATDISEEQANRSELSAMAANGRCWNARIRTFAGWRGVEEWLRDELELTDEDRLELREDEAAAQHSIDQAMSAVGRYEAVARGGAPSQQAVDDTVFAIEEAADDAAMLLGDSNQTVEQIFDFSEAFGGGAAITDTTLARRLLGQLSNELTESESSSDIEIYLEQLLGAARDVTQAWRRSAREGAVAAERLYEIAARFPALAAEFMGIDSLVEELDEFDTQSLMSEVVAVCSSPDP